MSLSEQLRGLSENGDNKLDVLIEIALFKPDSHTTAVRSNAAGTKVIYTNYKGNEETYWPSDWTVLRNREVTLAALEQAERGEA